MNDLSGGNSFTNSQLISKHDWYFNNGDMRCGNVFINIHTLSQYNVLSDSN